MWNNFIIKEFIESPHDISAGHVKIEELNAKIPLSMIIVGKKSNLKLHGFRVMTNNPIWAIRLATVTGMWFSQRLATR